MKALVNIAPTSLWECTEYTNGAQSAIVILKLIADGFGINKNENS